MRGYAGGILILVAVILFSLLGLLWVTSEPTQPPDADLTWGLLSFGLASFALGHLAPYWTDRP